MIFQSFAVPSVCFTLKNNQIFPKNKDKPCSTCPRPKTRISGTRYTRVEIINSYFVDNEIKNGWYANFYEVGSIFFNPICYNRIIETFPCFVEFTLFHMVVDVCEFAIFLNGEQIFFYFNRKLKIVKQYSLMQKEWDNCLISYMREKSQVLFQTPCSEKNL